MPSGFSADHEMLDALAALRAGGMPVALVQRMRTKGSFHCPFSQE